MPSTPSPLLRRRIVITRPREQAGYLAEQICAYGGIAVLFPTIAIEGILPQRQHSEGVVTEEPAGLSSSLLAAYQGVIFVSRNAVMHAMITETATISWPTALKITAIGPGTYQALLEKTPVSRHSSIVLAPPPYDSEALLSQADWQKPNANVAQHRILLVTGDNGRDFLARTLQARGFFVDTLICYRRILPMTDPSPLWVQPLDAVLLTSSQGARNWASLLTPPGMLNLRDLPYFVLHPRIADTIQTLGFTKTIVTKGGDKGLLEGLVAYFSRND